MRLSIVIRIKLIYGVWPVKLMLSLKTGGEKVLETYTLIARNVANMFIAARDVCNFDKPQAAMYVAMMLNAQPYLKKGDISEEDIVNIISKKAFNVLLGVEYFIGECVCDVEKYYFLADTRFDEETIVDAIQQKEDDIQDTIDEVIEKGKPGFLVKASVKSFCKSHPTVMRKAQLINMW